MNRMNSENERLKTIDKIVEVCKLAKAKNLSQWEADMLLKENGLTPDIIVKACIEAFDPKMQDTLLRGEENK